MAETNDDLFVDEAPRTELPVNGAFSFDPNEGRSRFAALSENEAPTFFDAFQAAAVRENFAIEALRTGKATLQRRVNNPDFEVIDDGFNVAEYIQSNWDEDKTQDMAFAINDGLFDDVFNEDQFNARVTSIEEEREALRVMEGNIAGSLTGAFATALLDPTTYIPVVGVAGKATRAVKLTRFLTQTTALTGVSEALLHQFQDLRTLEESFMNIGASTVLAGGLGAFAFARSPTHPLHPSNPDNPFHPNIDEDVSVYTPGEGRTETFSGEQTPGTVSAAENTDGVLGRPDQVKVRGGGRERDNFVAQKINQATPTGRAFNSASQVGRKIFTALVNTSHIFTNANRAGHATTLSAEDIRDFYTNVGKTAQVTGESILRNLVKDLGVSRIPGFKKSGEIANAYNEMTLRSLHNDIVDDALEARIAETFGKSGLEKIRVASKQYAEEIHKANEFFESKMLELGVLRDEDNLASLLADRAMIRAETNSIIKTANAAKKAARGSDDFATVQATQDKIIADARAARDQRVSELNPNIELEQARPKALGRDYGVMQSWDPYTITENFDEFKNFLYRVAINHDSDLFHIWLEESKKLSRTEFDELADTNPQLHREIADEYAGDSFWLKSEMLENELKGAEEKLKQSELTAGETLRTLKLVDRETVKVTRKLALKKRDELALSHRKAREATKVAKKNARAFAKAAEAARTTTLARQQQFIPVGGEVKSTAFDLPLGEAKTASHLAEPTPTTIGTATADATAKEAQFGLNPLIREEQSLARKLEAVQIELRRLEMQEEYLKGRKFQERQLVRTYNKERNKNAKTVRGIKRELKKHNKLPGITDIVEKIARQLAKGRHVPSTGTVLDDVVGETGRFKERVIHINDDALRKEALADRGFGRSFLRRDLPNLLNTQYEQLSGHLALREVFGLQKGLEFDAWGVSNDMNKRTVIGAIEDDYRTLINEAEAKGDTKLANRYRSESKQMVEDTNHMKDRLLGMYEADSHGGMAALRWVSKKMRQANVIRFASGFGLTSLTDVGAVALHHQILPAFVKHGKEIMESMGNLEHNELLSFIYSLEAGSSAMMLGRRFGDTDLYRVEQYGIGLPGTMTHRITNAIDRAGERLSGASATMGALPFWNRFMKTTVAVQMSYRLREMTMGYSKLTDFEKTRLASLGIGKSEAEQLAGQFKKFSRLDENGRLDVDFGEFDVRLANVYKIAIQRDMNRAIVTPGIGDTPTLMSNDFMKTLLQFYTFGFATLNRFITPMIQGGAMGQHVQASSAALLTLVAGSVVAMGKAKLRGEDVSDMWEEENLPDTAFEILDRSGFLAYLSAPISAAAQAAELGGASRYRRSGHWFSTALGVNGGLAADTALLGEKVFRLGAGRASVDEVVQQANKLRPFSTLISTFERGYGNLVIDNPDFRVIDLAN